MPIGGCAPEWVAFQGKVMISLRMSLPYHSSETLHNMLYLRDPFHFILIVCLFSFNTHWKFILPTQCYKIVQGNDNKNWKEARDYCLNQGGNLISILNEKEQGKRCISVVLLFVKYIYINSYFRDLIDFLFFVAFLLTQMVKYEDNLWIGMNDVNWDMHFVWTDGRGISYTNWAKGQPVSHSSKVVSTTVIIAFSV